MAGSKRMSLEEKRKAVLAIYHHSKSVYTEKEILTLAAKTGVNANTYRVADINSALVDDGLVDKEKIGGSNYFWSFPAKKDRAAQLDHQHRLDSIAQLQAQVLTQTASLTDAKRGRQDNAADGGGSVRATKLQRLQEISTEQVALQAELATLRENDPQALLDLEKELQLCIAAANRWTDIIFNCKSYMIKKRGMDRKEVEKLLGISSAFDYPEDKIPK